MDQNSTVSRDVGAVLAEFAGLMADERSAQLILERLGAYCTELLPVTGVGVLLKNVKGDLEAVTAHRTLRGARSGGHDLFRSLSRVVSARSTGCR
jgi:hypothetical protein